MVCRIEGCVREVHVKKLGLCNAHYLRFRRHGDPVGGSRSVGEVQEWLEAVASAQADECVKWPFARTPQGYGVFTAAGEKQLAHRHVCEIVHGPAPSDSHFAIHSCGKGHEGCVSPRHLSWGTAKRNQADRVDHGTSNRGERAASHKLTEQEVRLIRERIKSGASFASLAAGFEVSYTTIFDIDRGRTWHWLH